MKTIQEIIESESCLDNFLETTEEAIDRLDDILLSDSELSALEDIYFD